MGLDVYAWLAQRLHRVEVGSPAFISWSAIKEQFGHQYGRMDNFKRVFRHTLDMVLTQYRSARIELDGRGMTLRNRVMFGPHFTRPMSPPPEPEGEQGAFTLLVSSIEAAQAAGLLRAGESRPLTLTAWSLVHGLASLFVDTQLSESPLGEEGAEGLARVQTRLLVEGLKPPARGWPAPASAARRQRRLAA